MDGCLLECPTMGVLAGLARSRRWYHYQPWRKGHISALGLRGAHGHHTSPMTAGARVLLAVGAGFVLVQSDQTASVPVPQDCAHIRHLSMALPIGIRIALDVWRRYTSCKASCHHT